MTPGDTAGATVGTAGPTGAGSGSRRGEGGLHTIGGRYRLLAVIGRGGMSTVYLALDTVLNKQWAAKEIRKVEDPVQRELIANSIVTEANMIKRFDHPAIPRIVDIVDEDGTLYVIMDYVEGHSLDDVLEQDGPQPEDVVVDWALQLCDVLEYLHQRNPPVIYRDMKPANVMLKPNGLVEVIDFGIAREMRGDGEGVTAAIGDTVQLGTRGFAPPEQYGGGRQTDARSDVYALGATIYNLLTGKSPADPPYEILPLRQVVPDLSQGIERIVAKATQANPEDRYEGCAEMAYDLAHYQEQDDAVRRRLKRTWNLFVGLSAAALVSLAVGVGGTIGRTIALQNDYDHWMQIGEQSAEEAEATDAYVRASQVKADEVAPYLGLVEQYRADQSFSRDEEAQLRAAILPNVSSLQKAPGYSQLAYEIGKLYWYDYDMDAEAMDVSADGSLSTDAWDRGRNTRIRAAAEWMHQAASDDDFENRDLAQAYADVADFNKDIVPLINEGSDEGRYQPYFERLQSLVSAMQDESNEVMRLETANLALDALRTYPRKFRADNVFEGDMEDLADQAVSLAEGTHPTTDFLDAERDLALAKGDAVRKGIAEAFVDARTVEAR